MNRVIGRVVTVFAMSVIVQFSAAYSAGATTIYSTFGEPGHTYATTSGWGLGTGGGFAMPFGSESFIGSLEFQLNQSLKPGKPGRPRKNTQKTGECPWF